MTEAYIVIGVYVAVIVGILLWGAARGGVLITPNPAPPKPITPPPRPKPPARPAPPPAPTQAPAPSDPSAPPSPPQAPAPVVVEIATSAPSAPAPFFPPDWTPDSPLHPAFAKAREEERAAALAKSRALQEAAEYRLAAERDDAEATEGFVREHQRIKADLEAELLTVSADYERLYRPTNGQPISEKTRQTLRRLAARKTALRKQILAQDEKIWALRQKITKRQIYHMERGEISLDDG